MAFEDFLQYFSAVTICRVHDDFKTEGLHVSQRQGGFSVFKVGLSEGGETYFITTQVDDRIFGEESGYEYSPVRMIVAKIDETESGRKLRYMTGIGNAYQRDVWCRLDLEAGDYLVYVEFNWTEDFTEHFGFSAYSASNIKIEDVSSTETNFIQQVYNYNLAKREAKPSSLGPEIYFYSFSHFGAGPDGQNMEGYLYDIIKNKSSDLVLELEVIHKNVVNIALTGEYDGSEVYKVVLRPGEKVAVVKKQLSIIEDRTAAQVIKRKKLVPIN